MGWGGGIGLIQLGLELEASQDRERGTGSVMGTRLRAPACTCVHLRAGHRCRASEPEVWSALVVGGRKETRKKKKWDFSYSIPGVLSHCTFVLARYWFSGHSGDQWKAHSDQVSRGHRCELSPGQLHTNYMSNGDCQAAQSWNMNGLKGRQRERREE